MRAIDSTPTRSVSEAPALKPSRFADASDWCWKIALPNLERTPGFIPENGMAPAALPDDVGNLFARNQREGAHFQRRQGQTAETGLLGRLAPSQEELPRPTQELPPVRRRDAGMAQTAPPDVFGGVKPQFLTCRHDRVGRRITLDFHGP